MTGASTDSHISKAFARGETSLHLDFTTPEQSFLPLFQLSTLISRKTLREAMSVAAGLVFALALL